MSGSVKDGNNGNEFGLHTVDDAVRKTAWIAPANISPSIAYPVEVESRRDGLDCITYRLGELEPDTGFLILVPVSGSLDFVNRREVN